MLDGTFRELPAKSPVILGNKTCVYCGALLTPSNNTKDHVIGRRFVPKGKLDGQWNLIVRACKGCNVKKSDLEDDISAITMQADAWDNYSANDDTLKKEAVRKAKNSISRRSGKPVMESKEEIEIKIPVSPVAEVTFNFTSPPQIESDRMYELARMHVMAFFYWVTFNKETKRGGFWLGSFFPVLEAPRSDWGNAVHKSFMEAVENWEPRVLVRGTDGFYKLVIRRHPTAVCWSWAIEWNQNYRVVGFFGQEEPAKAMVSNFPSIGLQLLAQGENYHLRYRDEKTLEVEADSLFEWNGTERKN